MRTWAYTNVRIILYTFFFSTIKQYNSIGNYINGIITFAKSTIPRKKCRNWQIITKQYNLASVMHDGYSTRGIVSSDEIFTLLIIFLCLVYLEVFAFNLKRRRYRNWLFLLALSNVWIIVYRWDMIAMCVL